MDIKTLLGNTAVAGILRAGVAAGAGYLASKGVDLGAGPDEIVGGIILLATILWSVIAKKQVSK